jgi:hypothetical protein
VPKTRRKIRIVPPQSPKAKEKLTSLLKAYEQRFTREREEDALLLAAELCLSFGMEAPPWVRENFSARLFAWHWWRAASLDEAFKVVRRRKHIGRQRLREEVRGFIVYAVAHEVRRNPGRRRKAIFAEIGKAFGQGGNWVEALFYEDASRPWRKLFRIDTAG